MEQTSKASGYTWLGLLLLVPGFVFFSDGGVLLVALGVVLLLAGLIGSAVNRGPARAPEPRPWHTDA